MNHRTRLMLQCWEKLEHWVADRPDVGWDEVERQKVAVVASVRDEAYGDHPWYTTVYAALGWEHGRQRPASDAWLDLALAVPEDKYLAAVQIIERSVPQGAAEYFVPTFFAAAMIPADADLESSADWDLKTKLPGHPEYGISAPLALYKWAALLGSTSRHGGEPTLSISAATTG
jgi:hypothetical protein